MKAGPAIIQKLQLLDLENLQIYPDVFWQKKNQKQNLSNTTYSPTDMSTQYPCPIQDLLHPTAASEARKHKLKTLVQAPRSYFLDVKCPGCLNITTVFSHAQTAVTCESCSTVLCTPTGGKAKLSEGTSFRRK
ncbi:40S ribosomal protein S27 [Nakaseomyces glabratus]|nr:40S ribosomal protein S27 [Nakaseomyces glabratus]